jgi:2-phosphoglycerate kinase
MSNKIILIGGASGSSKTSTSKDISCKYDIAHRIGSGFVREMAKNFITRSENSSLYEYSYMPINNMTPFQNLYRQSEIIEPMINLSIKRAFNEGTSIIVEGVNIIPGLNEYNESTDKVVLYVEDEEVHFQMIHGPTHKNRLVSKQNFLNVRSIQSEFIKRAQDYGWNLFDITKVNNVSELINGKGI